MKQQTIEKAKPVIADVIELGIVDFRKPDCPNRYCLWGQG